MEDIMIRYDGTVRSSNDRIIQVVYGDSGVDTTKQYEYLIKMIEMSDDDIKEKMILTSAEIKSIKGATEKDNIKLYETIIELRDILRECVMKSTLNYIALKDKFMLPVNINRIIDTVMGTTPKDTEPLTPSYIVDQIETLLGNDKTTLIYMSNEERNNPMSFKRRDEALHKIVFRAALYDSLNPKRMLVDLKVNKPQFDRIILEMAQNFNKNMIEPGEMAGIVAAQSTGEPLKSKLVLD
jgi:DNA-directed RNA polymerase II subunit RPB1